MSDDTAPELLVRRDGALGRLTLNRPQALGALTTAMCEAMTEALLAWRDDPAVKVVLVDHAGPRGFCAGGDIRTLAESAAGDGVAALEFFRTEYRLDHLIGVYPKPVVTAMDGVTMGGGVGISLPARHRIATERTRFAMPETGIGLFPDVGAGWFLPKLPGRTGLWIVLTGTRLGAADCVRLGIATHALQGAQLADFAAALAAGDVEAALARFAHDPGPAPVDAARADIDRLFAGEALEAVVAALESEGSDWALS
ncbi:MAG: enoyl-CoA hydratase/isomerase family protein, partial [Caulobacteraceae bacterium]